MRILLIGLFHETHCFAPGTTRLSDFTIRRGDELFAMEGDGSQIDGFLEVAREENWSVVPVCAYAATPSQIVNDAVLDAFWADAIPGAQKAAAQGVDAIYLSLHGAMVTTSEPDPEGRLIARLRAIPGLADVPIFGVFDLHANLTQAMTSASNGLLCYRENPHFDARLTAVRAARLLARALKEKQNTRQYCRHAPIIWPPTGTGTADRPMRDLEALARQIEAENPDIWAVNVVSGFSFADVPDAGVAFSVVTTASEDVAQAALARLADLAWELRDHGLPQELTPDEALAKYRQLPPGNGPVLLVEPAENIGAGAPGNGTAILRALVRNDVRGSGVIIHDPEAVQALSTCLPGQVVTIAVGGRNNPYDEGPLEIEASLVSLSDGDYSLEDINSHIVASQGRHIRMGPVAVVMYRGVTIMLTSLRAAPNDLAQWRSQGVNPEDLAVIGIKAAVAHRRAYDPIMRASYTVATGGPCSSDPRKMPYTKVRRPVFPLD